MEAEGVNAQARALRHKSEQRGKAGVPPPSRASFIGATSSVLTTWAPATAGLAASRFCLQKRSSEVWEAPFLPEIEMLPMSS